MFASSPIRANLFGHGNIFKIAKYDSNAHFKYAKDASKAD